MTHSPFAHQRTANQLRQFFHDFLAERGVDIEAEKLLKFHFVDSGLLDSFEILSMIMQLETVFTVQFTPEELADGQMATVHGLIQAVLAKSGDLANG